MTREGKEVNDFCVYDESKSFLRFFEASLAYFNKARSAEGAEAEQLLETLKFLQNCFRYNGHILDSNTINSLLLHILTCVLGPVADVVILEAIKAILALVESGAVITSVFSNLISVLCSCYNISADIDKVIWSTIHIIYATPMSIQLVYHVLTIINNPELRQFKNQNIPDIHSLRSSDSRGGAKTIKRDSPLTSCLGAILILELIALTSCIEDNERIDSFHSEFYNNLKLALTHQVPVINTAILRMFDRIFSKAPIEPLINNVDHAVVGKAFPFYFWHSQTHSLFDLLSVIRVTTEQDRSYWKSMCISLQLLYEDHEISCPKERIVEFFMEKHNLILDSNVSFVLKYYSDNSLCLLANPFHKDNIAKVLNHFYFNGSNSKCRIEALSIVLEAFKKSCTIFGHESIDYEGFFHLFQRSLDETDEEVRSYLFGPF